MKIIVDVMGADRPPEELIPGCLTAAEELDVDLVVVGDESKINPVLEGAAQTSRITVVHAPAYMEMCDEPTSVLREKKDSSMAVALRLLKDGGGDALVSPGNTGALLAGATMIVKRLPGIKRPALAPVLPTKTGKILIIDCGANAECRPEFLDQFAVMGSVYMKRVMQVENPRVGLANIGAEETKGTPFYREVYGLLKENKQIHFVGNVEGRGVMLGECDVIVSDGFTGNIILKTCEGAGIFMIGLIKGLFMGSIMTKLAALTMKGKLKDLKKRLDYNETGGAVMLGLTKPVIKAHGSTDAKALKNAIRQAKLVCEGNVCEEIREAAAPQF